MTELQQVERGSMLNQAIAQLATTAEPQRRYDELGRATLLLPGVKSCSIYELSPSSGDYELRCGAHSSPSAFEAPPRDAAGPTEDHYRVLIDKWTPETSASDEPQSATIRGSDGLVLTAVGYRSTIFAPVFATLAEEVGEDTLEQLVAIAHLAYLTYTDAQTTTASFANAVDFNAQASDADFYERLASYLEQATGFSMIALRELNSEPSNKPHELNCTVIRGWDIERHQFDIHDYTKYPVFQKAIDHNEMSNISHLKDMNLWDLDFDRPSATAVVPVPSSSMNVRAILSIAARCNYDFAPSALSSLTAVSRAIGMALDIRAAHLASQETRDSAIALGAALNAAVVASDASHSIRNQLTTIPESLDILAYKLASSDVAPNDIRATAEYQAVFDAHDDISKSIKQFEDLLQLDLDDHQTIATLEESWLQAADLVNTRLQRSAVEVQTIPSATMDVLIAIPLEQLGQVLFHLLLNSIDTFRSRNIANPTIRFEAFQDTDAQIRCGYSDNAGGVDASRLRLSPRSAPGTADIEDLFKRGVTSKASGSGNGLWIARTLLSRHGGKISVTSRAPETTFELIVPVSASRRTTDVQSDCDEEASQQT